MFIRTVQNIDDGFNMKLEMKRRKLTNRALAELVNRHWTYLSKIANGLPVNDIEANFIKKTILNIPPTLNY